MDRFNGETSYESVAANWMNGCAGAMLGALLCLLAASGCDGGAAQRAKIENAESQVARITEELDQRTTKSGVYVRASEDEIKEKDPWGRRLKVSYSQGGVAEVVSVRSAGPDGKFQTDDDIVAQGMAANLKGIGEGIKNNVEETTANAAKGAVKGTVEGVKESIKETFRRKKTKPAAKEEQRDESE